MSGRVQVGHALETVVLHELKRRKAQHLGYVKTREGFEVHFLVRYLAGGEELIQVCADPTSPETAMRELRALEAAAHAYPRARRRMLVLARDQVPKAFPSEVSVEPAYEWLLAEQDS